ncbi:MAG: DUF4038 domain-containing protein, partial [Planctomycetes bacterium]|nr:DUF4038 domain-containing protein [Planctomycetota bacterium]
MICSGSRVVIVLSVLPGTVATAAPEAFRTRASVPVEIAFRARASHANPFNDLVVDLVVTDPEGRRLRVPCFWAGRDVWKARYASPVAGIHRFRTDARPADDPGLHGAEGRIEVEPYDGPNILYRRGPIRVAPDHRHLEHTDGTPFFWLGDTWWMGLCRRLRFPDEFATLARDRVAKGFTVIQIVAGLYPDMPAFDERGANEAGLPWEKDWSRIRPAYFDAADRRLAHLIDAGLVPCIVGAWGYFLPWMGVEKAKEHWRYLVARYGAYPVVWCIAGEANLPYYLVPGFPFHEAEQVAGWTEVMRYVREIDPFRRLVTIHPTGLGRLSARGATDDVSLLDFDMLQTPHGEREAIPPTIRTARASYAEEPVMPVIDGEASYEHLFDRIPALYPRAMFWVCMLEGAAGHTYGANGIWQCNRREEPHGASPHGGSYGTIPWDDAMNLPGSRQVGLGKKLLERFRWYGFAPHPEWAEYEASEETGLAGCRWIWFPEGEPARNAPAEERRFRKAFSIPEGKTVVRASLLATADDAFTARVNGQEVGAGADWHRIHRSDVARLLHTGENAIGIAARNGAGPVSANPAGLIACLEIRFADGAAMRIASDASWQTSKDGTSWVEARDLGALGIQPWGTIGGRGEFDGPCAAGIPGSVRIIYVPSPDPIAVRNLGSDAGWTATYFDPADGGETRIGTIRADREGRWRSAAPAGAKEDWILILESAPSAEDPRAEIILENDAVAWHVDAGAAPRALRIENKLSGRTYAISGDRGIALTFSSAPDRIAEPLARIDAFELRGADPRGPDRAVFRLASASPSIDVALHYGIEGPIRRKWVEVTNRADRDLLLLDVRLDDFATEGAVSGGGRGQPIFIDGEVFAAIEHPSGINDAGGGHVQLLHHPGRRIPAGGTFRSRDAIVAVAPPGQALEAFRSYIEAHALRRPRALAVYTPFGINNQWGGCPTLDDEQTLDVLDLLERWQEKGVRFDYFTLDTGWSDPGDLMRFRPSCFPDGPARIVERVESLGMKFGLWFATSWAAESCWDDARALAGQAPLVLPYRNGYPDKAHAGRMFCFACPAYYEA